MFSLPALLIRYHGLDVAQSGAVTALVVGLTGLLGFYTYYVTVYASLQDVVEPRLRATAMAVYFFFQYVLGAAFGTTVAGALSDMYAKHAMAADGAAEMSNAFRAEGLHAAMQITVPLATLVTAVALWLASRSFVADAKRVTR